MEKVAVSIHPRFSFFVYLLLSLGWESLLGHAWEATGGNGFGNFQAGKHYRETLGRQREAMDLVTFGLGTTTATRLGGNGRQMIW